MYCQDTFYLGTVGCHWRYLDVEGICLLKLTSTYLKWIYTMASSCSMMKLPVLLPPEVSCKILYFLHWFLHFRNIEHSTWLHGVRVEYQKKLFRPYLDWLISTVQYTINKKNGKVIYSKHSKIEYTY